MKLGTALQNVQYDRNWEIYAKSPEMDADAQYHQTSNDPEPLRENDYSYITNGEQIGNYIRNYTEGIPEEDLADFTEEACENFLEELIDEMTPLEILQSSITNTDTTYQAVIDLEITLLNMGAQDPHHSLQDWLGNGDYDGSETLESILAEWQESA